MLVLPLACLAFLVQSSNPSPLPVPVAHLKNGDNLEHKTQMEDADQQKLYAPPHQCRAPPCTPSRILHRAKRTIDIFPFSLLKVLVLVKRYIVQCTRYTSKCYRVRLSAEICQNLILSIHILNSQGLSEHPHIKHKQ